MNEIRGLSALLATAGTVHSIEAPPEASDFASAEEWRAAHDDWYARTHFWRSTFTATGSDPKNPEDAEPGEWELA